MRVETDTVEILYKNRNFVWTQSSRKVGLGVPMKLLQLKARMDMRLYSNMSIVRARLWLVMYHVLEFMREILSVIIPIITFTLLT